MTLEQAIEHAVEVASEAKCDKCRAEHLQLVAWLQELQKYRKEKEIIKKLG
nr:MAG TPA: hypothetical protein [Caudoviricetes sp.]